MRFKRFVVLAVAVAFFSAESHAARGGGGRSSFSSGSSGSSSSRSFSSGGSSSSRSSGAISSSSSSRSFGSGGSTGNSSRSWGAGAAKAANTSNSSKSTNVGNTPSGTFNMNAGKQAAKDSSQEKFTAYKQSKQSTPSSSYRTSSGAEVKIDPRDQKISDLRQKLSYTKWENRELRQRDFYRSVTPINVHYNDPYSGLFWGWMLSQSIQNQALWAYNHKEAMDAARYNQLLGQNAALAAEVRRLEAQGARRDPSYCPVGMQDTDLMYTDNYVRAVYNPVPQPSAGYFWGFCLTLVFVGLMIWLIFIKRW